LTFDFLHYANTHLLTYVLVQKRFVWPYPLPVALRGNDLLYLILSSSSDCSKQSLKYKIISEIGDVIQYGMLRVHWKASG